MNKKRNPTPAPDVGAQTAPPAPVGTYGEVSVDLIDPNPEQPRQHFDEAELKELAGSIREHGVIQPIVIQALATGRYILHDGERRLRASKLTGLDRIPANIILGNDPDSRGLLLRAIVANDQRADLSPIERARGYQKLHEEHGLSDSGIATQVGKSRSVVANTRRLLQLPADQQAQVASGELNERQALALLPLYQLPEAVRESVQGTWNGKKLADPKGLTSDQIRASLKAALLQEGRPLAHVDPDQPFEGEDIHHPTCTGCDLYLKVVDDMVCLGLACLKAKQVIAITGYLEQAKAATGLDYVDPARKLEWRDADGFDGTNGAQALTEALEKKCPNLQLQFRRRDWDYGAGPADFGKCRYQCIHDGAGCACAGKLRADEAARENEQKEAASRLRNQAILHVAQLIKDNHPGILRAILYTMIGNWNNPDKTLRMLPEKVMVELARKIISGNADPSEYRPLGTNQQNINAWLAKLDLPLLVTGAAQDYDLDRRLSRIEDWIQALPDPAPAELLNGIRGNLANLAQLAEEMAGTETGLFARYDAAKATLLARREQAEQRAALAGEMASIRESLAGISAWLAEPEKHTVQKLLNRGQTAADLAYLVNTLIHQHGPLPELSGLLTEIELVEGLCTALRQKQSQAEALPQEVAA